MSTTIQRRSLDYRKGDEIIADVEALERGGYERCGTWSLTQIADHLTKAMERFLDHTPMKGRIFTGSTRAIT